MSLKDDLYTEVEGHGVKYIEVDENSKYNGLETVLVRVYATDRDESHDYRFSRQDTLDHMATLIKGSLRNRT